MLHVVCFTGRFDYYYVTCGSSLKLFNPYHNVRLHSHDVKYGSGSGQQVSLSFFNYKQKYCIDGVIVSMLPSSAVDRGFKPGWPRVKPVSKIDICCFSAKHAQH